MAAMASEQGKRAAALRSLRALCRGTTALVIIAGATAAVAQEGGNAAADKDRPLSMEEIIVSAPEYVPSASRSA